MYFLERSGKSSYSHHRIKTAPCRTKLSRQMFESWSRTKIPQALASKNVTSRVRRSLIGQGAGLWSRSFWLTVFVRFSWWGGESKDSLDPDIFLQQNEICGKSAKKMSYVGNNFLRPSKLRAQWMQFFRLRLNRRSSSFGGKFCRAISLCSEKCSFHFLRYQLVDIKIFF